jgi:hypothetical protein
MLPRHEDELEPSEPEPEPESFSRVDMAADPSDIARQFPDFPGAEAALTVEVEAGEGLFCTLGPLLPVL